MCPGVYKTDNTAAEEEARKGSDRYPQSYLLFRISEDNASCVHATGDSIMQVSSLIMMK